MSDLTLLLANLNHIQKSQKPTPPLPISAISPRATTACTLTPNTATPESTCSHRTAPQTDSASTVQKIQAPNAKRQTPRPAVPESAPRAPQFATRPQVSRLPTLPTVPQTRSPLPTVPRLASRLEPALPELLPVPQTAAFNPYLPGNGGDRPLDTTWANQVRPRSGSQLYQQRLEALRQGRTYTRLPADSFRSVWANATQQPTYQQWQALLQREAAAMAKGQGKSRLTVMVGDSISQWYPVEQLSSDRFWLNQGVSGDMTSGILQRLPAFDQTRPDTIHVMAGVNDLKNGKSDREILDNLRKIMRYLRQQHPNAQVVVHSILPTRSLLVPGDRIAQLNQQLTAIAQAESVSFLDLTADFVAADGYLQQRLTTDGIHLNPMGYALWGRSLQQWQRSATDVALGR
jgi:lysophospholipase L1-like esterase